MRVRSAVTVVAATAFGMLGFVGVAYAGGGQDHPQPTAPSITADVTGECGVAHVTWHNGSDFPYFFDIKVDDEQPTDNPDVPWDTYGLVAVAPGADATQDVTFDEDSGDHMVATRVAAGPEHDWYDETNWSTVTVKSDCAAPPSAVLDTEQVCAEDGTGGWNVTLTNPQDEDVTFKVAYFAGGQTLINPVTVPAGQAQTYLVPGVEDAELQVAVLAPVKWFPNGGHVLVQKTPLTLDCVSDETTPPPTGNESTPPPADNGDNGQPPADQGQQPPATVAPQPTGQQPQPVAQVDTTPAAKELAYTSSGPTASNYAALIGAGIVLLCAGVGLVWFVRRRNTE